ncbi:MAG: putative dsRNA-binding protein, partial [Oscillospiraceae bacterium]
SIQEAKKFVLTFVGANIQTKQKSFIDYKTNLQEIIQQNKEEKVEYILVGEEGPDHDKRFFVQVNLNSNVLASGSGKSKKEAEQDAARQVLELMGQTKWEKK